ncbi:hypothetical protein HN512_02870 [Candidatus Peregrinibacteria bacterium]|jgi:predicted RNase H-like HicB family nuclease|nr:hypothetical protein [Candidatus Peregrinibacteria bacterium]MBT3598755.1 hypothetical protein [Candidatus Peregrinibacteria bacterium]MBT4367577.1 hypothetical protein [Candidatus Peregrinibacteria bacterium]MBT4585822.1 hypothetical protein [Candidatus Peregrinibacteria bacterium]MBT6731235.1 hypothetical protein [Candidatus Peregrinibacteria bacterium]
MNWLNKFTGKSDSSFVREEILKRLPSSITIQFISEFDDNGDPIIFICSPDHEGLISEARTHALAIKNAEDAILTYFDVPKDCAALIEFNIEEVKQTRISLGDSGSVIVQEFKVKEPSYA